jgi:hypothetical protein
MTLIAGTVTLDVVIQRLADERPVFHSEADFEHAFGQVLHDLDPAPKIRLEVRQENAEYLDLPFFTYGLSVGGVMSIDSRLQVPQAPAFQPIP